MDLCYQLILWRYPFLQTLSQLYNNYYALDEHNQIPMGRRYYSALKPWDSFL